MHRRTMAATIAFAVVSPAVVLGTSATAAAETATETSGPILTEIIVWVDDDEEWSDIEEIAADHGVTILQTLVASKGIYLLGSPDELDAGDIHKIFGKDDRLRYAEPNYEGGNADGNRFHAWPSSARADVELDAGIDLGLDLADVHRHATGAGVKVAVLDTGVDADHDLLRDHITPIWDFVDDDDDPDDEATGIDRDGDGHVDGAWGHGTHISGIVSQIAPGAEVLSYRVLDSDGTGRVFAVAAAIFDAVDRDADVINLSFGLDEKSRSKMLKDALRYAKDHDVVVVAAAGNDADDGKRYPAAEKDVLSVGAIDESTHGLAAFANHGDWVEVAAPGVAILSTLPDGLVGTWSGSSMAAPFVSAQAALLIEFAPDQGAKKVANAIRKSCRKLMKNKDWKLKHGEVDFLSSLDEIS